MSFEPLTSGRNQQGTDVLITGLGVLTAVGLGIGATWQAVCAGVSGVKRITSFDTKHCPTRIGAQLPAELEGAYRRIMKERELRESELFSRVALLAADLALHDANLEVQAVPPDRVGVVVGNCSGAVTWVESLITRAKSSGNGPVRMEQLAGIRFMPNAASALIGIHYGVRGPNLVISTACSAGAYAIAYGADLIRSGRVDVAICGGAEVLVTTLALRAFSNLTALTHRNDTPETACRPFDRSRDGTVLGDGAGMLILESAAHARLRSVDPYARLLGHGLSCEGYSFVSPRPDGAGMKETMSLALASAGVDPSEVDYVNAHGTGTVVNDPMESKAIRTLFGAHADEVPVSSQKGGLGHTVGAAGGIEAALTAMAVKSGVIPPTINFTEAADDCDLDYVSGKARKHAVAVALSNSFALGGHNCTLVLGRL